ncbi:MAG: ATP-binding domain-containing protein [Polyangiaceae bacterium]|nr:ATP-binding domain-containing protein [Polyangiaceae bacterium]
MLTRVLDHLKERRAAVPELRTDDSELIALRDEISEARLEDVPALLAQMERIAGISAQRNEMRAGLVDPGNPYFAHLALRERDRTGCRERDVLIGRTTYVDAASNTRIVDWRHAPVSQIYYRYAEGDTYEERFGDRDVEGELLVRRTVTIHKGVLHRIATPQGTFVRRGDEDFRLIPPREVDLSGGQGKATRPGDAKTRGELGVGADGLQRIDRHLPEISALLDPRQFDLISRTDSGIVVIQGGAGSGKTTIGLHRLAYLNYQGPRVFSGERMMVITTSKGLVSFTSEVLPALGVSGVQVHTFPTWARKMRRLHFPWLSQVQVTEDTPQVVIRLKKHPGVLRALEQRARDAQDNPQARMDPHAPVTVWAELLTDIDAIRESMTLTDAAPLTEAEIRQAVRWCSDRCPMVAELRPGETRSESRGETRRARGESDSESGPKPRAGSRRKADMESEDSEFDAIASNARDTSDSDDPVDTDDDGVVGDRGIDGLSTIDDRLTLDVEDDALLLRACQLIRGPLRKMREPIRFEHLFVDEAQDYAVAELAVLIDVTSARQSITFAGDTSQRLVMDNHFRGWKPLFSDLGITAVEIEPLKIAYRSTREIMELAKDLLGPMADALPSVAPRTGAPVEAFVSPSPGVAVAQLGEALRALALREPRATVAVLARYSDQADMYFQGLKRSEVPNLHRIKDQDFRFRPGVEVTEIREVKGLEYDYVIVVDVNASTFPDDLESRHLLHVAATRAAHQLWLMSTGQESPVLPKWLVDSAL